MKKILKTLLSTAVITALASSAVMAGPIDPDTGMAAAGNSVTIPKNIAIYNDGHTKSYLPAINYEYTISAKNVVAGSDTVTDSNGNSADVLAGNMNAVEDAVVNVQFAKQEVVDQSSTDNLAEQVEGSMTFEFDPTAFTAPGIYRYVITDTTDVADLYAVGVTRVDDYDATRDLDVYVVMDNGTPSISGYVLSNTTDGTIVDGTEKDPGWVIPGSTDTIEFPGEEGGPGGAVAQGGQALVGIDYYQTFNATVTKTVDGDMVTDPTNQFPFSIALTNGTGASANMPTEVYVGKGSVSATATANTTYTTALANGDTYYIYGINPFGIVTATETNNTTQSCTVTSTDGAQSDALLAANDATMTFGANAVSDYATANSATDISTVEEAGTNNVLGVTNTFDSPDITGVIMTVAPFVAVFVAAAALFVVALIKKNNKKNAENA